MHRAAMAIAGLGSHPIEAPAVAIAASGSHEPWGDEGMRIANGSGFTAICT